MTSPSRIEAAVTGSCPGSLPRWLGWLSLALMLLLAGGSGYAAELEACFAPGTDPTRIASLQSQTASGSGVARPLGGHIQSRFATTATNGSTGPPGTPIVLTWSVVPDGTFIIPTLPGESSGASNLQAWLNGLYPGGPAVWRALIQQALDSWWNISGVTFVYEPLVDSMPIDSTSNYPGILGTRGTSGSART